MTLGPGRLHPLLAAVLVLTLAACAQARPDKSGVFSFEDIGATSAKPLGEWASQPDSTVYVDSMVVHSGRYAFRIERDTSMAQKFSSFSIRLPVDFPGDTVELRGWLRFENVDDWAGLWQRQDGRRGVLKFDNMAARNLHGTQDWTEYRVALPRDPAARSVHVGALLSGTGRVWVDDLQVLVDGRPLADAPVLEVQRTVLETDTTFASGSGVTLTQLTKVQADNLALLGKVWGFLKYHHPAVVAGKHHWDFDLFRVMPGVIAARDRAAACAVMAAWVDSLGPVAPCDTCAKLPPGRPVVPRLTWIADSKRLGATLSAKLLQVHARRPRVDEQFYVAFKPGVGNPDFDVELGYPTLRPDAGYRLLALFRFWNMVEYWFPYREDMDEDWDAVLREFVPRLAAADSSDAYRSELMGLIARVHDTHANLWSALDVRPPRGKATVPVGVRFVEGRALVTGWTNPRLGPASGLEVGDVIESIGGEPVSKLVGRWRPMYAASNEPTRLRDVARQLLQGEPGPVTLEVSRDGKRRALAVTRVSTDSLDQLSAWRHDHPGPVFRRLSADVAYLRLGPAKRDSVPAYFERAAGAKLLVLDHRNYPSDFPIFQIGGRLVLDPTPFVKFTVGDATNPGSFAFGPPLRLEPIAPHFEGKVVILVDETTQSSAEYHSLAFRSTPNAIVVGSTTAGADGNVSTIPLPGGQRSLFSGIGVFWPDGRPTQRVGIVPDVVATPTIAGLKARRDEVFDVAVLKTLGRVPTAAEEAALTAE
jgi:hypothetical protein